MARKTMSIRRAQEEAAAADAIEKKDAKDSPEKAVKKKAVRKSKAKEAAEVRMKLFWGVYNQAMKRVALYEYSQKKAAEKKAAELTAAGKSQHFIQKVKEEIVEKKA